MKRTILIISSLLLLAQVSLAEIPQKISYQGVLKNDNGVVVPDGEYELTFKIYAGEISARVLWSETQVLEIENGLVQTKLGSVNPIDISFSSPYWLGITVDDGAEMSPRIELTSSPYSFMSTKSDDLTLPFEGGCEDDTRYAFTISNSGANGAGFFKVDNESSSHAALLGLTYSNGGPAVVGESSGFGHGGLFQNTNSDSYSAALRCQSWGNGPGLHAIAGAGVAAKFVGNVQIYSKEDNSLIMELGEGLDYAEGFDLSDIDEIEAGTVLSIDPKNPGQLTPVTSAYDTKVAGIVAGAEGLGSGVRLGAGKFDCDVALAGRVYCNVEASSGSIEPGDLLTTSDIPGFAMKAVDDSRTQGAILGKAMESLASGEKGKILVLVTLQ